MDVSIIIPTYNRQQALAGCVQALHHNDVEIVVVDDGSDTPVVAPNARVLRHETNRGRGAAINTGLKAASHDMVLIMDDDIYAAPDMVVRLVDEFRSWNNPKLALVGRVLWDPGISLTPTMRWMEEVGPFQEISSDRSGPLTNLYTGNTLLWRPFLLEHGGYDENFEPHTLEDAELGLRLRAHGLNVRLHAAAVGYHHKRMTVEDLVVRQMEEGFKAVYLHSKFSDSVAYVDDVESLDRNLQREKETIEAVARIQKYEQETCNHPPSALADEFLLVYRFCSLRGIYDGLKARGNVPQPQSAKFSLGLYEAAEQLEGLGELEEARRLFRLVRDRQNQEYWAAAEYHLGAIESVFGNLAAAQTHFRDCLRLDSGDERTGSALSSGA